MMNEDDFPRTKIDFQTKLKSAVASHQDTKLTTLILQIFQADHVIEDACFCSYI